MKQCPLCKREMRDQLLFCPFDGQTLISVEEGDKFIGLILENKYRIDEKVGEGGMGKVYRGTHILMDHTVAIKILHPHLSSDEIAVERFRREARAAASIRHPNAVAVTDFGVNKETGLSYLVMEFLEGVELRDEIKKKGRLDFEESFIITQQICLALQAAHAKGIIHRDLKPDNIWLLKSEDHFPRIKVLDFGIAKLMANNVSDLTQQGVIVGTPYYMSPEQCVGDELDARSDIYSLGIIIYEILTGRVPFRASTPMGVALKHANEPPMPPHELRLDLPFVIENVVLRALRKHREERQGSAMELSQEFEAALYQAGVELKLLGTNTPQNSHTLSTYADQAHRAERSMSPDRSFPPADRSTPPDRSISPGQSAGGDWAASAQSIGAPQPEAGLRAATPDLFGQRIPSRLSIRDRLSELSTSRKILFVGLGAALIITAIAVVGSLTRSNQAPVGDGNKNVAGNPAVEPKAPSAKTPAGMALVTAGKFTMGYNASDQEMEKPEHEVPMASYFIDEYEVTVGDYYSSLVKGKNHPAPKDWPSSWKQGQFRPEEARLPVTNITWFDARDFAESVGKRLPTEEEWEYAARGADKRLYPWGGDFNPNYANVGDPIKKSIKPVGSFPKDKSPFAAFDMGGNVLEWTSSDPLRYPGSNAVPKAGKIARGGSFDGNRSYAMTSSRTSIPPDMAYPGVGFRCAKSAPAQ